MSELAVEIHEIGEDERAVRRRRQRGENFVDDSLIVWRPDFAARRAMGEYVADLADGVDAAAGLRGAVEQIALWRRQGEILAMRGAAKIGA